MSSLLFCWEAAWRWTTLSWELTSLFWESYCVHYHETNFLPMSLLSLTIVKDTQVVQCQKIHILFTWYARLFLDTRLYTAIRSISRPSSLWSLGNLLIFFFFLWQPEGYISVAPGFKMKKSTSWSLPRWGQHFNSGRPAGTYLKPSPNRKWKPSLSLLNSHQIKNLILFFSAFDKGKPHAYSLY